MKPTELCEQICSRYKNHKLTHNRYNHAEYCFSKCLKYSTDDNTVPCDKIMYADCPKCRYTNLKQIIRCTKHSKQNLWNTLKKNKTDKCKTKCNKKTELYRFCHDGKLDAVYGRAMKVSISKSKNTTIYYLSRSVRVGNKTTTKTVEKIGTYDEIKKICGDMDPLDWAKEYAAKRTAEEKAHKQDIIMRYSSSALIDKNVRRSCNAGYLFLQDIHYSLGLDKICNSISEKYKFDYDLNDILSMLVYSRIIAPGSKLSSLENAQKFLEQPKCELHQVYRALEVIAKENDFFQAELYKNSQKVVNRKKEVLYYDCTNYYFEIENEDVFRKYSVSKEHRPNPIVQMGMFMDADGIPLAFSVFDGNQNEQSSMSPLEQKIIKDFEASDFIVCTDAGLSSTANRKFNSIQGRGFVTTQSIKKLKGFLQDFCLEYDGWYLPGSNKKYKLSELDEETDYEKVFYKDRWINENNLEQHLIVTYSIKYRNYQRTPD